LLDEETETHPLGSPAAGRDLFVDLISNLSDSFPPGKEKFNQALFHDSRDFCASARHLGDYLHRLVVEDSSPPFPVCIEASHSVSDFDAHLPEPQMRNAR
jgi:hypothetical protein